MTGDFVAFVSTSTVQARDRLTGSRGWVRLDGLPFVDQVLQDRVFVFGFGQGAADDRLLSATSPETTSVELHEMSMADGNMTMRALPEGLLIPAGGTVDLAPGGIHLMLIGVTAALAAGQTVPVELRFEKAGTVTVPFAVIARKAP